VNTALHAYPSPFTHESRILRETESLVDSGLFDRIYVGAIWDEGLAEHEELDTRRTVWRVPLRTRRLPGIIGKLLRFLEWYIRLFLRFRNEELTFINCHSLSVLPLGVLFRLARGCRIIYDTHELETETLASSGIRKRLAKILERCLIGHTEAVIVVNESIAGWYRDAYGLKEVHVVRNIPCPRPITGGKTNRLREAFGIDPGSLLFLCQGILGEGRGIPILLEVFGRLPSDRHVVFLGNGPMAKEVRLHAMRYPNIHHHPAVPPHELLEYTAGADVGISLIENVCLSYYYSLPNKVFEYLMSGVPVVVSDFPEMARLVDGTGCGWKSSVDTRCFAELAGSLTREEIERRAAIARQVSNSLSWHTEEASLVALYKKLTNHQTIGGGNLCASG
jgi:glycosyltransferase involved in cell wall biosynthesis